MNPHFEKHTIQKNTKPVRQIVKRAPARTVRLINLKGILEHPVEAESSLEADFIYLAALLPTMQDIVSQPFTLPVSQKGYTPDFLQVCESGKKIVIEIKTQSKVKKYQDLFDHSSEYLSRRGIPFFVLTEKNLHRDNIQKRAQLICRYSKYIPELSAHKKLISTLKANNAEIPIRILIEEFQIPREVILHLISKKIITTGNDLDITDDAIVRLFVPSDYLLIETFQTWFDTVPWRQK